MAKRTIRIRGFTYYDEVPHPSNPDEKIRVAKFATRGEEVDLSAADIERGERDNAFGDPEATGAGGPASFDVVEVSDDEIDEYLENETPTVDDTVALAKGDPESAQRVLSAEERVTDGEPRKGVEEGLQAIIDKE